MVRAKSCFVFYICSVLELLGYVCHHVHTLTVAMVLLFKPRGDSSSSSQSWHIKLIIWWFLAQSIWQPAAHLSTCLPACLSSVWLVPALLLCKSKKALSQSYVVIVKLILKKSWRARVGANLLFNSRHSAVSVLGEYSGLCLLIWKSSGETWGMWLC